MIHANFMKILGQVTSAHCCANFHEK